MGTRHLTIVKAGGKLKVAQYGQWDGYPAGQGATVLEFLKKTDLNSFRKTLKRVKWVTTKGYADMWKAIGVNPKERFKPYEKVEEFTKLHPEMHRDTGAKILAMIRDLPPDKILLLDNAYGFLGEFDCQWAYEIDLDDMQLRVYKGGTTPCKSYFLDKLPTVKQMGKDCGSTED